MQPSEASTALRADWDDKDGYRFQEIEPTLTFERYKREVMSRLGGKYS